MKNFKEQIIQIAKVLNQKNLLAACDGNISFRESNDAIWITPSGVNKAFIEPSDLALIDLDNRVIVGNPSGERLMHLEVYRKCPQAKAIVHAHPPTAISWTIARPELKELPLESLSEGILALDGVPIAPYARPGTQEMGTVLSPFLPNYRVIVLSRHGAISWGEDLTEAYNGIERLEHLSMILKFSQELGGLTSLPKEEISYLKNLRNQIGPRTF